MAAIYIFTASCGGKAMDHRLAYFILALFSTVIFFVAVGYDGWGCEGSILSGDCSNLFLYRFIAGLLLVAGTFSLFASVLLIPPMRKWLTHAEMVALALGGVATIAAMTGMFYYTDAADDWSPFIAAIAMSLTVALSTVMLLDFVVTYG